MKANKLPLSLLNDRKKVGIIIIYFIEMHKLEMFSSKIKRIFYSQDKQQTGQLF